MVESLRSVVRVVNGVVTHEGEGFQVRRPFPTPALADFDPFLLLDEMGPMSLAPGEAKGAPDHPHRGFETVTYMLAGRMDHRDSQGNQGSIGPGDVQWMTAGAGVVHSEMPAKELLEKGGWMHGFQLWVNLPKKDKMMRPRYQEIPSERIPKVQVDRSVVRVIAGEAFDARAVIETRTPLLYFHVTMAPAARLQLPVPYDHNVFAYVTGGRGRFGAERRVVTEGTAVLFGPHGADVFVEAGSSLDFLLIGGVPLREPVVRYGPFAMNTKDEIAQAFEDFRSGKMGTIPAERV